MHRVLTDGPPGSPEIFLTLKISPYQQLSLFWYPCVKLYKISFLGFPGSPVVKTLPSNSGGAGSIPDQETKIPNASGTEKQNIKSRSNIVTNSIKTLNTVHIKKK